MPRERPTATTPPTIVLKKASDLKAPKFLPRHKPDECSNLAHSLRKYGQLQPIVARPNGEVVIGANRLLAHNRHDEVPVIERDFSDLEFEAVRLGEQISGIDLPFENKAKAFKELKAMLEQAGQASSTRAIATFVGCSQSTAAQYLRADAETITGRTDLERSRRHRPSTRTRDDSEVIAELDDGDEEGEDQPVETDDEQVRADSISRMIDDLTSALEHPNLRLTPAHYEALRVLVETINKVMAPIPAMA
jgi:ParB-like chromosome segregation protein Spo0J